MKNYIALKYSVKVWFLGLLLSLIFSYFFINAGKPGLFFQNLGAIFQYWGINLIIHFPAILIFWRLLLNRPKSKKEKTNIKIYLNISLLILMMITLYVFHTFFNKVDIFRLSISFWKENIVSFIILSTLLWWFELEDISEEKVESIDHLIE